MESVPVDRNQYCFVQTPQVFHYPKLMMAYKVPYEETFTDDASVWEADGRLIQTVEGKQKTLRLLKRLILKLLRHCYNPKI